MRLDELPTSDRIEDRRRFPAGRAGLGIGTVLILGLIGWALGIDPPRGNPVRKRATTD